MLLHAGLPPDAFMALPLPGSAPREGTSSTAHVALQPRPFEQAAVSLLSNTALPPERSCARPVASKQSDAAQHEDSDND